MRSSETSSERESPLEPLHDENDPLQDISGEELAQLQAIAAAPAKYRVEDIRLGPGARIADHLRIERRLGAGAMGAVFVAFDERLERNVAIKVHLDADEKSVVRLEREARALARINHPNVLAVHEVGKVGERLFVATEYVQGRDLRAWLDATPRRKWTEIVEVFIAAGDGLVAAHRAGLVHRDFKPANVLIGDDGRVRVADFGLARNTSIPEPTPPDRGEGSSAAGHPELTASTRAAGIPAYMAPEQARGHASARADQFSYCIALAEALWGVRPYGKTAVIPSLTAADFHLPAGSRVPGWLRALVRRGAALDPEERFDSMQDVVDRLRAGLRRRERGRFAALSIGSVAVVASALVLASSNEGARCREGGEAIGTVWNDEVDRQLATAFAHAQPEAGAQTWQVLSDRLDAYASAWAEGRAASCRATHEEGTQSDRLLEQSMACFERRREELSATLRALTRIEAQGIPEAWGVVPEPLELAPCRDASQLLRWIDTPPPSGSVLADIRYAQTLGQIGLAPESIALLQDVVARADARHDERAALEAELQLAWALVSTGKTETAFARAESVYFGAKSAGILDIEATAAMTLADWAAKLQGEHEVARLWLKLARAISEEVPFYRADVARIEAMILEAEGRYDEEIELLLAVLPTLPEGPSEKRVYLLDLLATGYDAAGRPEEALATVDEALAMSEVLSGNAGAGIPFMLNNKGLVLGRLGRHDEALSVLQQALDLQAMLYGEAYVDAMGPRLNVAAAHRHAGDPERALELLERAYEATKKHWGDEHPDVALVLETRGLAHHDQGRYDEALRDFGQAIRIARAASGADHPSVATYLNHSAATLVAMERTEEAREAYLSAVSIWERAGQATHPLARGARVSAAQASLALEEWSAARDHAEAALAVGQSQGPEDSWNLRASFVLARALVADGTDQDRDRGFALGRQVVETATHEGDDALATEARTWLDAHAED